MKVLFKRRLFDHLIEMTKYLRFVLNDFFLLALIFFIGGLGFGYSNWLKTLNSDNWWSIPLSILIFTLFLQVGGLATLFKNADKVFLLPKEISLRKYLNLSFAYSYLMAIIPQVLVWFIMLPFLRVTQLFTTTNFIGLLIELLLLKFLILRLRYYHSFQLKRKTIRIGLYSEILISLILLTIGFYTAMNWLTVMITFGVLLISELYLKRSMIGPLNWNHLITSENHRMYRIYRFFNMFTDVPQLGENVKRRRYLNPIINLVSKNTKNTKNPYFYMYFHGIIRDTETSGLYLRLTIIGTFLVTFLNGLWLPLILSLLFIYLIGFQLIPFYFHFNDNVFTHIYPLPQNKQLGSFQVILNGLLVTTTVLFAVFSFVGMGKIMTTILILILGLIEDYIIIKTYLPKRIKRERKFL